MFLIGVTWKNRGVLYGNQLDIMFQTPLIL